MTTRWWEPADTDLSTLIDKLSKEHKDNQRLVDNHLFAHLFSFENGLYAEKKRPRNLWFRENGELVRVKCTMRRREWIEAYVKIVDKKGNVASLVYNPNQRAQECLVLRMERAGVPVRVIGLKGRQLGFSTYWQAFIIHIASRGRNTRCMLVADTQDRARMILGYANTARVNMPRFDNATKCWDFAMTSQARFSLIWDKPIFGEITITSSETYGAGAGGTRKVLVMDEVPLWKNAEQVMGWVGPSLPMQPGTYGVMIGTANGASGLFYDEFWKAWRVRDVPIKERARQLKSFWNAGFFAWYQQPEYRWTVSSGEKELPEEVAQHIRETLTEDEESITKLRYFRRWTKTDAWEEVDGRWRRVGIGMRNVDLDQIAWYRSMLEDAQIHGDKALRAQEYPSTPEVAFRSSGSRVFDIDALERAKRRLRPAEWVGDIVQAEGNDPRAVHLEPNHRGFLSIWKKPEEGRQYVIGADTSGGGEKNDLSAAVVGDGETGEVVAILHGRIKPELAGRMFARLAWHYNEAILAIETHPSPHGIAACHAAINYGYQNIYRNRSEGTAAWDETEALGYRMTPANKMMVVSRLREAVIDGTPFFCATLHAELSGQRWDIEKPDKMVSDQHSHDDLVIGFGIMLMVRGLCWQAGTLRPAPKKATTDTERFWDGFNRRLGQAQNQTGPKYIA